MLRARVRRVWSAGESERRRSVEGFVLTGDGGPGVSAACDFEHILAD